MRVIDDDARRVIGQRPQDRDGLGRGEGEVEPDDRVTLSVIEPAIGPAERVIGQQVGAVAEHGRHRRLGHDVARADAPGRVTEPGESLAVPAAGRIAGPLVVRRQGRACVEAGVARSDVPSQVRVPVPSRQLVHRHHAHHLPSRRRRYVEVCGTKEKMRTCRCDGVQEEVCQRTDQPGPPVPCPFAARDRSAWETAASLAGR